MKHPVYPMIAVIGSCLTMSASLLQASPQKPTTHPVIATTGQASKSAPQRELVRPVAPLTNSGKYTGMTQVQAEGLSLPKVEEDRIVAELKALAGQVKANPEKVMIGKVSVDARKRTITLPCRICVRDGALEYLLVHSTGKVHESLFATEAEPKDMQLACLLLGASKSSVKISVEWDTAATRHQVAKVNQVQLLDMVDMKGMTVAVLRKSPMVHVGSEFGNGGYLAQKEGSMISLIDDASAIMQPQVAVEIKDDACSTYKGILPADADEVRMVMTFEQPGEIVLK